MIHAVRWSLPETMGLQKFSHLFHKFFHRSLPIRTCSFQELSPPDSPQGLASCWANLHGLQDGRALRRQLAALCFREQCCSSSRLFQPVTGVPCHRMRSPGKALSVLWQHLLQDSRCWCWQRFNFKERRCLPLCRPLPVSGRLVASSQRMSFREVCYHW